MVHHRHAAPDPRIFVAVIDAVLTVPETVESDRLSATCFEADLPITADIEIKSIRRAAGGLPESGQLRRQILMYTGKPRRPPHHHES